MASLAPTDDDLEKLVCFVVAGQEVGAPIRAVRETVAARPLTRVPLVRPVVAGLVNLRGDVVPVLDLAVLLGLPPARRAPGAAVGPLVLLRALEASRRTRAACGLLVEALLGTRDVPRTSIVEPPRSLAPQALAHLAGVTASGEPPRPLLVVDPARILGSEQLRALPPSFPEPPR